MSPRNQEETSHQLRCYCSRRPLLATYGVDRDSKLYVHIKVYKQRRVYGNIKVTGGTVELQCRECIRWYKVVIRDTGTKRVSLEEIGSISGSRSGDPVEDHGGPHPAEPAKVGTRND